MDETQQVSGDQLKAYLIDLAQGKLEDGIIHEPRTYFDIIELNEDGQITAGHAEVFKNGEQFPVRLTHMSAAIGLFRQDNETVDDERNIQRVGLRMNFHNQAYMNPEFLPVPIWSNKVVAAPDAATFGTAAWRFDAPFILSARDTIVVDVAVEAVVFGEENIPQTVTVTFTGYGLLSGRPYLFSGDVELDDISRTTIGTTFFRNDGSEPVIVTDVTANIAQLGQANQPAGDIRNVSLNIRQSGNGTNAFWCQGPEGLPKGELMPGPLWGITSGRAVVHHFPAGGLIWEPGEGISLQTQALGASEEEPLPSKFLIALTGYITIT